MFFHIKMKALARKSSIHFRVLFTTKCGPQGLIFPPIDRSNAGTGPRGAALIRHPVIRHPVIAVTARAYGVVRVKPRSPKPTLMPTWQTESDHRERPMSYLPNVANDRPMLRVAATVILAFCFAAPLVWLFSSLVVYGVRALFY
jgi:hypothetical protein